MSGEILVVVTVVAEWVVEKNYYLDLTKSKMPVW